MVSTKVTVFITGKISWAKVLGEPVVNYNKDGREWTFELQPNEAGLQSLIKNGLEDRIKGRGYNIGTKGQHKEREPFIQLKKTEFNKDGEPNSPIRIYDADDEKWDQETKIGNGSDADVKLDVRDYGPGKKKGMYPAAIRITELIPYEGGSEFGGMDQEPDDDAPKAKAKGKKQLMKDFELDDEIPF